MSQTHQSPLDQYRSQIEELIAKGFSYREVVEALAAQGMPTSDRSLRRALDRWQVPRPSDRQGKDGPTPPEAPGFTVTGDQATATGAVGLAYSSTKDLLVERGLDPEDWEVKSLTVNEWDSPTGDIMKQLKVNCHRKRPHYAIEPAQIDLNLRPPSTKTNPDTPRVIVCVGDQQAPYHNKRFHEVFRDWLDYNKPDEGVLIGDSIDVPVISRHAPEPEWAASTQECINAGGQIFYDYRHSSIDTKWTKLAGNHDERLRRVVINNIADFYGLKPAEIENLADLPPIHHPRNLLRLDELGIEYIEPNGSYDHASVALSPFLAARHGWLARKNSGASAHATLDHLGHSIIVGHTHRQSRVHQTKFTIDGEAQVRTAIETGCMCRIEEGLGYAVCPDWQNGFAVATVWPDGTFSADLATYVGGALFYRDQRYS